MEAPVYLLCTHREVPIGLRLSGGKLPELPKNPSPLTHLRCSNTGPGDSAASEKELVAPAQGRRDDSSMSLHAMTLQTVVPLERFSLT